MNYFTQKRVARRAVKRHTMSTRDEAKLVVGRLAALHRVVNFVDDNLLSDADEP